MADNTLVATVASSNLPVQEKSLIYRMAEKGGLLKGGAATLARAKTHAIATGQAIRAGGEGVVVGAALGAAAVYLPTGLDANLMKGKVTIPLDAAAGALALAGSALLATEEVSTDLRNSGAVALGIFSYRKTNDLLASKMLATGKVPGDQLQRQNKQLAAGNKASSTAHGESDIGEDPIVKLAQSL